MKELIIHENLCTPRFSKEIYEEIEDNPIEHR